MYYTNRALHRGTWTILLVEDEDAVRTLATLLLQSCGFQVFDAERGTSHIHFLRSKDQPVHMRVSDVVMPYLGGRELAEQVRHLRPSCKILLPSGYTDDAKGRNGVIEAE